MTSTVCYEHGNGEWRQCAIYLPFLQLRKKLKKAYVFLYKMPKVTVDLHYGNMKYTEKFKIYIILSSIITAVC